MPKKFVQDIVPGSRRSIRNIPLPDAKSDFAAPVEDAPKEVITKKIPEEAVQEKPIKKTPPKSSKTSKGSRKIWVWAGAVAILFVFLYAGSFLFVSATVTVTPKESNLPINISGTAALEPTDGQLAYTIVTLSRQSNKEVRASGEEKVDKKASGKVVIYNNYSASPQVLIAKTRFETSEGLIFRIADQVTVPGQKITNGVATPGTIAVTVYADQPGTSYNIGLADFTIPGFKGDPRFEKFSAKSDPASPIAGGFSGVVKKVTPTDAASAKAAIETKLKNDLQDTLASQIPDTHILFKNASTFSFAELPQGANTSTSTALITEKGDIYGIIFAKEDLSKFLTNLQISGENKNVDVANLDSLTFSIDNIATFNPATSKTLSFKLAGNAKFVWQIDQVQISDSLVGQKRSNVSARLADFDSIEKANVTITPVWFFTLPKNSDKIKVIVEPAL